MPVLTEASNSRAQRAISSPPRSICPTARFRPMRCLRIASPAARTCWRPGASRRPSLHEASRVLRFDFTGLGSSEGDFANSTFSSNVADLVRAADHLRQTRKAPAILIGHSLGGAAILAAAGQIPEAKAVATIAAPSDPAHVTHLFKDRVEDIRAAGQGGSLAGRPPLPHQARIPRRRRRTGTERQGRKTAQGAACHALADRRHRRHRQRHASLRGGKTSEELYLAVGRRSPAEPAPRLPSTSPM